jgi:cysteinyl-tRNA synthetase
MTDTRTRQVEEIVPATPGRLTVYACGPTVYRYAHVGNLRTFLLADLVRRTAEEHGLRVQLVQNITDVGHLQDDTAIDSDGEDKLLAQARAEGKDPFAVARFYEEAFHRDLSLLGVRPADAYPRASECIDLMVDLIARLVERGHAYVGDDGTVYYDARSFPSYGAISGNRLEDLRAGHGATGESTATGKRFHADWALWKRAGEAREMTWDSPWGRGFPGWHIECSAMSLALVGDVIDLHLGGIDLRFPHHEDERAQSDAAVGHEVVSRWVHGEHLLFEGRKMAKSTGNVVLVSDLVDRGLDPLALRLAFLQTRYRQQANLSWDGLVAADRQLTPPGRRVGGAALEADVRRGAGRGARGVRRRSRHPAGRHRAAQGGVVGPAARVAVRALRLGRRAARPRPRPPRGPGPRRAASWCRGPPRRPHRRQGRQGLGRLRPPARRARRPRRRRHRHPRRPGVVARLTRSATTSRVSGQGRRQGADHSPRQRRRAVHRSPRSPPVARDRSQGPAMTTAAAAAGTPPGAPRAAPPPWRQLVEEQGGVISRRQALAGGMTADSWQWCFTSGRWQHLLPGVALTHAGTPSDQELAWAAVLACGEHAALTADAALRSYGMRLPTPRVIHVATPGRVKVLSKDLVVELDPPVRVQPHRVVRLEDVRHPVRRPPVVRAPAAVLHAAAWAVSPRAAEWRVAAAVQQRLVTPAGIRDAAATLHHVPRRSLVLTVLDDVEQGAGAQSELDLLALLRRLGLPLPDRLQRPVRTATGKRYLDAWWERWRLGVEVDGAHHMNVREWDADVLRANSILVEHLADRALLMRFTTGNLRHDGDEVGRQLTAVLR